MFNVYTERQSIAEQRKAESAERRKEILCFNHVYELQVGDMLMLVMLVC